MTTAARPTFDPARGGSGRGEKDLSALSKQYSSRDLPGHTKLKYRLVVGMQYKFVFCLALTFRPFPFAENKDRVHPMSCVNVISAKN